MSETWGARDPVSLFQLHLALVSDRWWFVHARRYRNPWLSYTLILGLGPLSLVLRVHLPWRKP